MATIPGFVPTGTRVAPLPGLPDQADLHPLLTRTHYFDGRLLTAADLTREQLYLDQRLREVGQALGSGVVEGLAVTLSGGRLSIGPGLAVTEAGRLLQVRTPLPVNLNDRGTLAGLNDGQFARLPHGLFALVLAYAERPSGVAEVFPRDLTGRTAQHDLDEEGVQAALLPLPVPLPQSGEFPVRAALMRLAAEGALDGIGLPEDAVALGVLAISGNAPRWLDTTLLRHPPRGFVGPGDRQADLGRQYEALLADVLAARLPLDGDFAALDHFRVLPPAGRLPKAAIDPVAGRQRYFPEHFRVAVAPIRQADLELVLADSMGLPPIDLLRDEPVDLMVLAPLPNQAFGALTAALVRPALPAPTPVVALLPRLDPLTLRLHPLPPVHVVPTDAPAWGDLWAAVGADAVFYVRRPTRAAETGLSAIRIAAGAPVELEEPPGDALPSPGDVADLVLDEDALLLRRVDLPQLVALRIPPDAAGRAAVDELRERVAGDARAVLTLLELLALIERRYDALLWPTLLAVVDGGGPGALRDGLVAARTAEAADAAEAEANGDPVPAPASTAALVAALAPDIALPDALLLAWRQADPDA